MDPSIVPGFHPTSSICSSFSNIFKLRFIFFLKHLNMGKSLFYLSIALLNESFILPHIMLYLTSTLMLFTKSSTLILSFIPFSSNNPEKWTGGATGLSLLFWLCFWLLYRSTRLLLLYWLQFWHQLKPIMNIKVQMKYLSFEELLIELRLFLIKNNIIRLVTLSSPYWDSSLLESTSSIILNLNLNFDPCTYTSINLQDNDTNTTIIIIQISIPIGFNSTSIPNDITDSVNTSDHNFNPLWEVIHILFLLNIQRSWILNLENRFSIQKMNFNKRFDVIVYFSYVSNFILPQIILKIGDCSLLLILIEISFSSLTSSFYGFNFLVGSLCKHLEGLNHLSTDVVPFSFQ